MNAEATTTVGITKGMKVKLSRNFLNLNSDFTNTLDMHSPIATDNAEETVACQIVNQRALRTDTEVKVCSNEERLNPIESILPIGQKKKIRQKANTKSSAITFALFDLVVIREFMD